ncbi:helix-turn-helix domain-containing protein [Actinocrispum sp. NPDC049592]|uniref:TetR/AcrR family transcriptional regulator n=1 Tax=Actinocrispum sp. NPDC049592 TaxID=3154835 RepID=UPI003438911E
METRRVRRPRADGLRNRARIVATACEVFAEQGPDAALDEIARRAETANATVYRHFPDRNALLYEVVLGVLRRLADEATRPREADPFAAVSRFMLAAAGERIAVICPLLAGHPDKDSPELAAEKERLVTGVSTLVTTAQEAGRMRDDVSAFDLLMTLAQLTRPLRGGDWAAAETFARRSLQLYLDGLVTPARSTLPGRPPEPADLRR